MTRPGWEELMFYWNHKYLIFISMEVKRGWACPQNYQSISKYKYDSIWAINNSLKKFIMESPKDYQYIIISIDFLL